MRNLEAAHAASVVDPEGLRSALHISRERMGRLLDVTSRTVERSERERRLPMSRTATERLAQLRQIVDLGLTVYTVEGFREFMATPLAVFGNGTALQAVERGQAERVLAVLASDYEGAPS